MKINQRLAILLRVVMAAMLIVLMLPLAAFAALTLGPIDPLSVWPGAPAGVATGFPAFYADATGIKLALMPITGNGVAPPTQIYLKPDPLNPYSTFLGFDSLASYFNVKGTLAIPTGRLTYAASLDAGFPIAKGVASGAAPGQEVVTETVTVKMDLVPGQEGIYTIQEPYGKATVTVTAAEVLAGKGLKFATVTGAAPRVFTSPFAGPITAYLKPTVAPPPGWLGDGATLSTVTGSPTGFNSVLVSGPAGKFTITLFTVSGRLFTQIAPVASFTMSAATGGAPFTVNFTDTSVGPPSLWSWNFGDGSAPVTVQNPSHIFLTPGTFTVTETVTNAIGTNTVSQVVTVTPGVSAIPVTSFTMAPATGPAPLTVNFTDTTTGVPTTWSWTFGDASAPVTLQNPTHTFLTAGTFTVTELATNALGSNAISKTITVTPPVPAVPVAAFSLTPTSGPVPLTVNFSDITTGVPTAWTWNFGDGSPLSSLQNPSHVYTIVGTFAVTESVTNALGSSIANNVVTVTGVPAAALPAAPSALAAAAVTSTDVKLTWTDNADNESLFMVQRAPDATFINAVIEMHPAANTVAAPSPVVFNDITVVGGTTYFYRVLAGNSLGNSAPSNVVSVITPAVGAPVPAPAPGPAAVPGPAPAPAPAAGGGGGGGGGAAPAPAAPTNITVALLGLVSSTGLRSNAVGSVISNAQVKTANDEVILDMAAGTSMTDQTGKPLASLSAAADAAPPAPPAGGTILAAFNLGPSGSQFAPAIGLKMRFDAAKVPAGSSVDNLYIAMWDGKQWIKLASTVDKAAGMVSAKALHFTEFAIISGPAPSATAPEVSAPDQVVVPAVPQDLNASATPTGEARLSWTVDQYDNGTGFMIERAPDSSFTTGVAEFHVPALTGTFTDITGTPGKTYFYRVEAVHGVGHSDPSNVVSVTLVASGNSSAAPSATSAPTTTTAAPLPATSAPPVSTPAQSTKPVPAQSSSGSSSLMWIIIGVVGAIVVVAVVVLMLRRKHS